MLAAAHAAALIGLEARPVRVEVACERGPGLFEMVGLAEASVRESRVRVNAALAQLNVLLAEHRIAVNLAPADVRKNGTAFDLAIAVAVLVAIGKLPRPCLDGVLLIGELSLSGALRPVRGVLPQILGARNIGLARAIVPEGNGREAAVVAGVDVRVASSLGEICSFLSGQANLRRAHASSDTERRAGSVLDLSDVRGQHAGRRALEVAAAGAHNLLFVGPPGAGKSMLARRLPTILPPLTFDEALTVTMVRSVAGLMSPDEGLVCAAPIRSPHHSVTLVGLVGGGDPPRPGEVSLAHHGVLFLDELAEFRRAALEALRQPLEDGEVVVARARWRATFPASPLLIAAVNPCPCGYAGNGPSRCVCSPDRVKAYRARLSGPLLDRIDLHVSLPPVDVQALSSTLRGESSDAVRGRVLAARRAQLERFRRGLVSARLNSRLSPSEVVAVARPDPDGLRLLTRAIECLGLSARAYDRILRVARTIADLDGAPRVAAPHVAEAIQGRVLDRQNHTL